MRKSHEMKELDPSVKYREKQHAILATCVESVLFVLIQ